MSLQVIPIHFAVISKGRPQNVAAMEKLLNFTPTWYVGEGETQAYKDAGATFVIEAGGLCQARNKALETAFRTGLYCFQLSDDLKEIKYALNKKETNPISFSDLYSIMLQELRNSPFHLCGVSPTSNPFFVTKDRHTFAFVVGDCILIKPTELRFDENMILKEDYDYTVEHIKKYGGILRLNRFLLTFQHKTNKGGAVEIRTLEREQSMIRYLNNKHPWWFRENPNRAGEILLRKQ